MDSSSKYKILRIYLSNTDKIKHTSVYKPLHTRQKNMDWQGLLYIKG